ncbi:MAG: hypothetical protein ACRD3V_11085 [Vicinamibacteria bacterium]
MSPSTTWHSRPGAQPGPVQIHDRELLRRFETVDKLSDGDKSLAKEILDLVIMKHRFKELVANGK